MPDLTLILPLLLIILVFIIHMMILSSKKIDTMLDYLYKISRKLDKLTD